MSLTPDQVQRIRDSAPGWEKDWGQLCVLLLGEDGESGALVQAVNALPVTWPSEDASPDSHRGQPREGTERDDFVSRIMLEYHRRASRGRLLTSYDPSLGDVVSFLTSRRLLYVEAIKFLKKLAVRQLPSFDDPEFRLKNEPAAKPDHDAAALGFRRLITSASEELQRMKLEGIKRVTRVAEQAALQLYPRLDWSQSAMNPLREHLLRVLCPPSDGIDPLTALSRTHQVADQSFQKRLERLSAKMHNKGKGVSIKRREHLERLYGDLCSQRVFLALDADTLVRLLGIKLADAAQRRHRYRTELPRLLPGLGTYYEALREHRSAASRGKSL